MKRIALALLITTTLSLNAGVRRVETLAPTAHAKARVGCWFVEWSHPDMHGMDDGRTLRSIPWVTEYVGCFRTKPKADAFCVGRGELCDAHGLIKPFDAQAKK